MTNVGILLPSAGSERSKKRSSSSSKKKKEASTEPTPSINPDVPAVTPKKDKVKPKSSPKKKRAIRICILALILLIIGAIIVLVYMFALAAPPNYCDNVFKSPNDQLELQICQQFVCEFDISACSTPCPFGYNEGTDRCPNGCTCASDGTLFQGDIQFSEDELPNMLQTYDLLQDDNSGVSLFSGSNAIVANPYKRWSRKGKDGYFKISYEPCNECPSYLKQAIDGAFEMISKETCVDFVEKSTERQTIYFTMEDGCFSKIGKQVVRKGRQAVNVGSGCQQPGVIAHELLHLIGFVHEESRRDRDLSIKVDYENIKPEFRFHFKKLSTKGILPLRSEYDVESIMQNSGFAFSESTGSTILNLFTGQSVEYQRTHLTETDYAEVNALYKCEGRIQNTTPSPNTPAITPPTPSPITPAVPTPSPIIPAVPTMSPTTPTVTHPTTLVPTRSTTPAVASQTSTSERSALTSRTPVSALSTVPGEIHWAEWGTWEGCDVCVTGAQGSRVRSCENGVAVECIKKFDSENFENLDCALISCPGNWEEWGSWKQCSRTCGGGLALRSRACDLAFCEGDANQAKRCNSQECIGSPQWTSWVEVDECDHTCGAEAVRVSKRQCIPFNDDACDGEKTRIEKCKLSPCPDDAAVVPGADTEVSDFGTALEDAGIGQPVGAVFERPPLVVPKVLCQSSIGTKWVFGDFNGDDRADVVCGRDNGRFQVGLTAESSVIEKIDTEGRLNGCSRGTKFSADFNGDGFEDLLCKDRDRSSLSVKLWENGQFSEGVVYEEDFCLKFRDELYILDVDGDGRTDILCHHYDEGYEVVLRPVK